MSIPGYPYVTYIGIKYQRDQQKRKFNIRRNQITSLSLYIYKKEDWFCYRLKIEGGAVLWKDVSSTLRVVLDGAQENDKMLSPILDLLIDMVDLFSRRPFRPSFLLK